MRYQVRFTVAIEEEAKSKEQAIKQAEETIRKTLLDDLLASSEVESEEIYINKYGRRAYNSDTRN